jgi:two-component system phosphate regulon sensor histidine kinase PhoR
MKANPKQLSLYLAIIFTSIVLITSLAFQYTILKNINVLYTTICIIISFTVFYIVLIYSLEKFIYAKIKIIYKTILHSKKVPNKPKNINNNNNILEAVNSEVVSWAKSNENEITELKRLEAYRREFLGNVSHELKTPLTTIQGYVLTLLDGGIDDPSVNKKYLLRTAKSINRLISIVNDLETISKFEAGIIKLVFKKFNIVSNIIDVFEFMEIKAKKRNIKLVFKGNIETPCFVLGDMEKIRQVLINLIDNSLKYGKDDGTTKVGISDMDDHVLVEISDDGIGIDETDISRVFERFYRTEKSRARTQGGTGLGLAIVKHIIEAHEQNIHVRSNVGEGSTFAFTLKKA